MFYGWHIGFVYKAHTFRWQYWNWIDMYETDKRLQDYQEYKDKCIINGEQIQDSNDLVTKLERCIENYNDIKNGVYLRQYPQHPKQNNTKQIGE